MQPSRLFQLAGPNFPMRIEVVTDSTCDIPLEQVERYRIHVVPNLLISGGRSIEDDRAFSRKEFYAGLAGMREIPTTSTASSGVYQALYESLFRNGCESILSIHASSRLSGIFNAASIAAQAAPGPVHVVDSRQVSLGLGFQVLAAAEAICRGLPLEGILTGMEQLNRRARVVAMLDTLEYLRRSGRVSWAKASLGNLLNLKLFIEVREGVVHRIGESRTRRKGTERLLEMIEASGPLERLAILHTNDRDDAQEVLERVKNQPTLSPAFLMNITPVVGVHVGPKGLGFACLLAR